MLATVIVGIVLLATAAVAIKDIPPVWRAAKKRNRYQDVTLTAFRKRFALTDRHVVIDEVHSVLQQWMRDVRYPIDPDDDLGGEYGLANEDLVDVIISIATKIGIAVPTASEVRTIRTVRDLVNVLSRQRPA